MWSLSHQKGQGDPPWDGNVFRKALSGITAWKHVELWLRESLHGEWSRTCAFRSSRWMVDSCTCVCVDSFAYCSNAVE